MGQSHFGRILLERGRIDAEALEGALRRQLAEPGIRIGELLARMGLISSQDIAATLAAQLGKPLATAVDFPAFPVLEEGLSQRFLRESLILPLAEDSEHLVIAMADPTNVFAIEALRVSTGREIDVRVAAREDIETAFERLYGAGRSAMGQIVDDMESVDVLISITETFSN